MLSSTFPYPPSRGGPQVRTFNLLKYLARRHDVTLVTQRSRDVTDEEVEALRCCVHRLAIFPRPEPSTSTTEKMRILPRTGMNSRVRPSVSLTLSWKGLPPVSGMGTLQRCRIG